MNQNNSNDIQDFEEFYKTYNNIIYNYLKRLTGDGQDAEDILQEVLIKIAERLSDLRDPGKVKTWAFKIATNTAIDLFRKRDNNIVFDELLVNHACGENDIEDRVVIDEMNECIHREMGRLAPLYHTALVLHYFEHMSIMEISKICDISEATVKIRLHRGKDLLHRILSEGCDFYYDKNNNMRCSDKSRKQKGENDQ